MYDEDQLLPISALQHLLFCPRQCALIHIEQLWAENRLTAEGRIAHEKVDQGGSESRHGVKSVFGLPLRSFRLGLIGKAGVD
jgi:CRISPR-associated exonuclease Cas4